MFLNHSIVLSSENNINCTRSYCLAMKLLTMILLHEDITHNVFVSQ
uniref:Uncharacterized protein n=1 Tax=Lepeophtheirus salmonis TaxID=72036 RepID=A0A0K2TQT3_LEPSM